MDIQIQCTAEALNECHCASSCEGFCKAHWRFCSTNSTMKLTCCLRFGNGMVVFVPGTRFGMRYRCIRVAFDPERSNLCTFCNDVAEDLM